MIKTLDEHFTADIAALVETHGCAHFLPTNLAPVARLQAAIDRLAPMKGRKERACVADLRKLLKK